MKIHQIAPHTQMLVLQKGENVIASLTHYCQEYGVQNAIMSGIGAVEYIKCGYYDLQNRVYHFTEYQALYEVVSLTANVMLKEGVPFVHMHGVFSDTENHTFGGHVEEMRVGVTLEIHCSILPTQLHRAYDEETGLFLIASST